jgi:hypothetical protein
MGDLPTGKANLSIIIGGWCVSISGPAKRLFFEDTKGCCGLVAGKPQGRLGRSFIWRMKTGAETGE